jgi:hypothetical protein
MPRRKLTIKERRLRARTGDRKNLLKKASIPGYQRPEDLDTVEEIVQTKETQEIANEYLSDEAQEAVEKAEEQAEENLAAEPQAEDKKEE